MYLIQCLPHCMALDAGHTKWITAIAWEPAHVAVSARRFVSGSKDTTVKVPSLEPLGHIERSQSYVYFSFKFSREASSFSLLYHACLRRDLDPQNHVLLGDNMPACGLPAMCCADEALHLVQVWDAQTKRCLFSMASHTMAITAVKWGGDEHIYTAARDCSINVWDAQVRAVFNAQVSARLSCL